MTEYVWKSPGGLYVVPTEWKRRFLSEFPNYRVRWSLKKGKWQVEQYYGAGALPPIVIDEADDTLVRARDGYWLVMEFSPGDRFPCPGIIEKSTNQRCGWALKAPMRKGAEVRCPMCRSKGRDGRTVGAYWPFDEFLLEHLRKHNPETWGVVKVNGQTKTRAAHEADLANLRMTAELERQRMDASTLDYTDLRWLTGIPTAGVTRRQLDSNTFT